MQVVKEMTKDDVIMFNDIEPGSIYVFGFGTFKHYNYVNDQFFYHDMALIIR